MLDYGKLHFHNSIESIKRYYFVKFDLFEVLLSQVNLVSPDSSLQVALCGE